MALSTLPSDPSTPLSTSTTPDSAVSSSISSHPPHLLSLASQIAHNLTYQHDWTAITTHTTSFPRPLLSGLPPTRIYVHPDTQIRELLHPSAVAPTIEREWVLPTHIRETWTLRRLAAVFDSLPERDGKVGEDREKKRVILATMNVDSTVVYYIVHDGIVKPRQN